MWKFGVEICFSFTATRSYTSSTNNCALNSLSFWWLLCVCSRFLFKSQNKFNQFPLESIRRLVVVLFPPQIGHRPSINSNWTGWCVPPSSSFSSSIALMMQLFQRPASVKKLIVMLLRSAVQQQLHLPPCTSFVHKSAELHQLVQSHQAISVDLMAKSAA